MKGEARKGSGFDWSDSDIKMTTKQNHGQDRRNETGQKKNDRGIERKSWQG